MRLKSLILNPFLYLTLTGCFMSGIYFANASSRGNEQYQGKKIKCIKKIKTKGFACTIKGKRVKYYWEAIHVPYCDVPTYNGGTKFDTCSCDCGG